MVLLVSLVTGGEKKKTILLRTSTRKMVDSAPIQGPHKHCYLQALQLFDQRPAAYKALVEQGQYGRTFQDRLPESSPRTYRGQMDISAGIGVPGNCLVKSYLTSAGLVI